MSVVAEPGPTRRAPRAPGRVVVVGGGIVGLSCAWALQEWGIEVCVADRAHPGAGASWGNAGYVSPAMSAPLPEPQVLRHGIRAVVTPGSPVRLLASADPALVRFVAAFARSCTARAWQRGMAAYVALNDAVAASYERQHAGGVGEEVTATDVLACFTDRRGAAGLLGELEAAAAAGQSVRVELLTGRQARDLEPHLRPQVTSALRVLGQHYLDPSRYVVALAESVAARGGEILEGRPVTAVRRRGDVVVAESPAGELVGDAAVVATGAWLSDLARCHGVRVPVYAGRGYSFTVPCDGPLAAPVYFPSVRIALAPQRERVRVTGIMELGAPDAPARPGRVESMVAAAEPLLSGVDWGARADEWVGPRPLSADGVPLVGETRTSGVYVAGGHGMWGVTLGPPTGLLLAEEIATGAPPAALAPLDPCR